MSANEFTGYEDRTVLEKRLFSLVIRANNTMRRCTIGELRAAWIADASKVMESFTDREWRERQAARARENAARSSD